MQWNHDRPYWQQAPAMLAAPVAIFTCPTNGRQTVADKIFDPLGIPPGTTLATTDYAYSKGATDAWCLTNEYPPSEKGVFHINFKGYSQATRIQQITDGTSHTLAMGEAAGDTQWPTCGKPGCTVSQGRAAANIPWTIGNLSDQSYVDAGFVYTGIYATTLEPMNKSPVTGTLVEESAIFDCRSSTNGGPHSSSNFRSDHPGGALFLLCDGSVHFFSAEIEPRQFRAFIDLRGRRTG